jgi:hypothetical protein
VSQESPQESTREGTQERKAGPPSEEELRAHLEEELRRVTVRDVLLQTVVTLVNLAGQRLGLGEAGREGRDLEQVRLAIESVRALLPLLESSGEGAEQVRPIRDALSQLQLVYAREVSPEEGSAGEAAGGGESTQAETPSQPAGAAERGRERSGLWVPPGTQK